MADFRDQNVLVAFHSYHHHHHTVPSKKTINSNSRPYLVTNFHRCKFDVMYQMDYKKKFYFHILYSLIKDNARKLLVDLYLLSLFKGCIKS